MSSSYGVYAIYPPVCIDAKQIVKISALIENAITPQVIWLNWQLDIHLLNIYALPGQWLTDAKDCITQLYDSKWTHSRNWFENIGSFHLNLFAKLAVYGPSQLSWTLKADGRSHSSWYWLFSSIYWHLVDHFSKLLKELRLNLAGAYQTWIVWELHRARNDFIRRKHYELV